MVLLIEQTYSILYRVLSLPFSACIRGFVCVQRCVSVLHLMLVYDTVHMEVFVIIVLVSIEIHVFIIVIDDNFNIIIYDM